MIIIYTMQIGLRVAHSQNSRNEMNKKANNTCNELNIKCVSAKQPTVSQNFYKNLFIV
jgi:hypothetical protein